MSRRAEIDLDNLTPEQQKAADDIVGGPRGSIRGPFVPWLNSPELAGRAQRLGEFARYHTSLPERLKELAILVTARHWAAQFEWWAHAPLAIDAGLAESVVAAIADHQTPDFVAEDEAAIYAFCSELYTNRRVSDATYRAVAAHVGDKGAVELVGVLGYYALVSMTLNVFEVEVPGGDPLSLPDA
ncbi:MAG: carboxymuconolactone decarboxylase family protein [Bauldia litoralis]